MMLHHKEAVEEEMAKTFKYLEQINYKLALYDSLEAKIMQKEIKI